MGLRQDVKDIKAEQQRAAESRKLIDEARPHAGVEYKVEQLRESLIGGKMDAGSLQDLLNERASQGWTLRHIVSADVKGRVGPGGVDGLLVVFERTTVAMAR